MLHARWLRDARQFAALPLPALLRSGWLLSRRRLRAWQRRAAGLAGKVVLLAPARLRRRARLPRLLRRARTRRLRALPVRRAGWLRGEAVLLTGLLPLTTRLTRRRRRGAVWSRQGVRPLRPRLQRLPAVRIGLAWIGAAEGALLVDHAPTEILRRVKLAHKPLIAQNLLRRDRQRHRGRARSAHTAPDRKAAGAARQRAELGAAVIIDLDPPDPAVRIGIELDRDIVRRGGGAFRHLDEAGGAARRSRPRHRQKYRPAAQAVSSHCCA